jgi:hypothetical protein
MAEAVSETKKRLETPLEAGQTDPDRTELKAVGRACESELKTVDWAGPLGALSTGLTVSNGSGVSWAAPPGTSLADKLGATGSERD